MIFHHDQEDVIEMVDAMYRVLAFNSRGTTSIGFLGSSRVGQSPKGGDDNQRGRGGSREQTQGKGSKHSDLVRSIGLRSVSIGEFRYQSTPQRLTTEDRTAM